jgi:hypothetical protein
MEVHMQSGMSMDSLLAEVSRKESAKKDFLVGPRKMMMEKDTHLSIENNGIFEINENAHQQFAAKFDIPKKFYDDLPRRAPGLRSNLVNGLMSVDKETRMVRTLDGKARALVSDRFRPIDDFLVMQAILPVLKDQRGMEVMSLQLSEARMYLQLSFPRLQGEVVKGQVVQAGVTITNSEVGLGSQDVRNWLLNLRCTNGMVGESIMRRYHVGKAIEGTEGDYAIYSDETIMADLHSFQLRLRDTLRAALTQAAFDDQILKLRKVAGEIIPDPAIQGVVENVTKHYAFTQEEGKKILENIWTDGDRSRWGLANAVTALVHNTTSVDRQYEIEKIGSDLVTGNAREWGALMKV